MAEAAVKRFSIPSDLSEALKVVELIISETEAAGYDENARFAIRLALDEAVANAVRHGNDGDPQKIVKIEYRVGGDEFSVTIEDEGPGFDPDAVPDPTLDENLERPCGRGVMLMRAYMTDVQFNKRGNRVTMVWRKDRPNMAG